MTRHPIGAMLQTWRTKHFGAATPKQVTSERYRTEFGLDDAERIAAGNAAGKAEKALTIALDIRKFEIDLYRKRATYFWAFIAVAFAAYGAIFTARDLSPRDKGHALLTASCVGTVFSVAWFFVNRASKFWQENWEKHVDLLEEATIGPLYKTVLQERSLPFFSIVGAYRFSVSKLNQILSLFVVALFILLSAATMAEYFFRGSSPDLFVIGILALTVIFIGLFIGLGRTKPTGKTSKVIAERRTTEISSNGSD